MMGSQTYTSMKTKLSITILTILIASTAANFAQPESPATKPADVAAKNTEKTDASVIMARSLAAVQLSFAQAGKTAQFEALKPWLVGDTENLSQSEIAAELRISTGAIKVMIHRLRKEFRDAVESEIAQTVPSPDDIGDELRYLVEVLS